MKNYISINGVKTELTEQQVSEIASATKIPFSPLAHLIDELRNDRIDESYKVGDTVKVGDLELVIIGIDHDEDANDPLSPTVTFMAKQLLPERRMHSGGCKRGWIDTELRAWLSNEFINELPQEILQYVCKIEKITHDSEGNAHTTVDKLFIPSESELFGSAIYSGYEDGARYEAFATSKDRQRIGDNNEPDWYWTRSVRGGSSTAVTAVSSGGHAYDWNASSLRRVPLCFTVS